MAAYKRKEAKGESGANDLVKNIHLLRRWTWRASSHKSQLNIQTSRRRYQYSSGESNASTAWGYHKNKNMDKRGNLSQHGEKGKTGQTEKEARKQCGWKRKNGRETQIRQKEKTSNRNQVYWCCGVSGTCQTETKPTGAVSSLVLVKQKPSLLVLCRLWYLSNRNQACWCCVVSGTCQTETKPAGAVSSLVLVKQKPSLLVLCRLWYLSNRNQACWCCVVSGTCQTETKPTGAVSSLVLVAATSRSSPASTTTVDRRAYFAELQVQLSSCRSYLYKAMKRVVPDQLPYQVILNTRLSPALSTYQMSATLLTRIISVTRRIFAHSKYRPMETN